MINTIIKLWICALIFGSTFITITYSVSKEVLVEVKQKLTEFRLSLFNQNSGKLLSLDSLEEIINKANNGYFLNSEPLMNGKEFGEKGLKLKNSPKLVKNLQLTIQQRSNQQSFQQPVSNKIQHQQQTINRIQQHQQKHEDGNQPHPNLYLYRSRRSQGCPGGSGNFGFNSYNLLTFALQVFNGVINTLNNINNNNNNDNVNTGNTASDTLNQQNSNSMSMSMLIIVVPPAGKKKKRSIWNNGGKLNNNFELTTNDGDAAFHNEENTYLFTGNGKISKVYNMQNNYQNKNNKFNQTIPNQPQLSKCQEVREIEKEKQFITEHTFKTLEHLTITSKHNPQCLEYALCQKLRDTPTRYGFKVLSDMAMKKKEWKKIVDQFLNKGDCEQFNLDCNI